MPNRTYHDDRGVPCDQCGSTTTRVKKTLQMSLCIRRVRECMTCGSVTRTTEVSARLFHVSMKPIFQLFGNRDN
jgi:uncharacterized Zn finger protein